MLFCLLASLTVVRVPQSHIHKPYVSHFLLCELPPIPQARIPGALDNGQESLCLARVGFWSELTRAFLWGDSTSSKSLHCVAHPFAAAQNLLVQERSRHVGMHEGVSLSFRTFW